MAGRCWTQVIFRQEHRETVCKTLGMVSLNCEAKEWELGFEEEHEEEEGVIYASESEVNYGLFEERENLAKTGVPFYGYHSAGGNSYWPHAFAAHDGQSYEWPANDEGDPVVTLTPDGLPLAQVEKALVYLEHRKEAERQVHNRPQQEDTRDDKEVC